MEMLQKLSDSKYNEIKSLAQRMVSPGKGILAADEAITNMGGFTEIGVENIEENRRRWRQLLFEIPDLSTYLSGVIINRETAGHRDDGGILFIDNLKNKGIIVGITLDFGPNVLYGGLLGETETTGLDSLDENCVKYKKLGCDFVKWRAIYKITKHGPSQLAIDENARTLARYASICQNNGLVPLVEPDILRDGDHTLETCKEVSTRVWASVFKALNDFNVCLDGMILKTNMVTPGSSLAGFQKYRASDAAKLTVDSLGCTVPPAMPGIAFLSGGQTEEEASVNLNAINQVSATFPIPWKMTFCYGRALQKSALQAWKGQCSQKKAAQDELIKRAEINSRASVGKYLNEY